MAKAIMDFRMVRDINEYNTLYIHTYSLIFHSVRHSISGCWDKRTHSLHRIYSSLILTLPEHSVNLLMLLSRKDN